MSNYSLDVTTMPIEKSAGAVIFRKEPRSRINSLRGKKGIIQYLLLNYSTIGKVGKTYWGLTKGTIERGEKEIDTILREVKEETGIENLKFLEGFQETERYFFRHGGKTIFKTVYYLLAETKTKEIKVSFEHIGYQWLSYEDALKKLTFKNAKEILKKANDYLLSLNSK